jgi:hypothetical protein
MRRKESRRFFRSDNLAVIATPNAKLLNQPNKQRMKWSFRQLPGATCRHKAVEK